MLKKVIQLFEQDRDKEAYALARKCGFEVAEFGKMTR